MKKSVIVLLTLCLVAAASCARQTVPAAAPQTEPRPSAESTAALSEPASEAPTETAAETQIQTSAPPALSDPPALITDPTIAPTQIPLTTTGETTTSAPAPVQGAIPFTAQYLRTGYVEDGGYPRAKLFDSRVSLDAYFADKAFGMPSEMQKYSEQWFGEHRLILLEYQENSGSVRHTVTQIVRTADGVRVQTQRTCPQVYTCDMAQWHIPIEVADTTLHGDDHVDLVTTDREG